MKILGLSYNYHDAAACLVIDGAPVAAAEEERFSRRKHDAGFPAGAISFCLQRAGMKVRDLDAIAFYEKPARKLERILQIGKTYAPATTGSVVAQFQRAVDGGIGVEDTLRERLDYLGPVYFCEHHLAHAASAFFCSPFEQAAILTVDGVGEWATCGQFAGTGKSIAKLREIQYPHSLGLLYSTITSYLGFAVNDDEYKVMGLAGYGAPRYRAQFDQLLVRHGDGSFSLNLPYFAFMHSATTMFTPLLEDLLGLKRPPGGTIEDRHRDIATSLQALTDDVMVDLARSTMTQAGNCNLCLAGGVALNCVSNAQIIERSGCAGLFIQPAAGDGGTAMGAALWASHVVRDEPRVPARHNTLLGPAFDEQEIRECLHAFDVSFTRFDEEALCRQVAALIWDDCIIGWFQGRMEFGPRALGARSILANACSPEMQDILNTRVKFREEFRPFAPAVCEEAASDIFEMDGTSPYMLRTVRVRPRFAAALPSITHVDGTARVQTVSAEQQPLFHKLIRSFADLCGIPVVINTSFNVRGEPIVCTPANAVKCFLDTDIDFLAIGPFLVTKVTP